MKCKLAWKFLCMVAFLGFAADFVSADSKEPGTESKRCVCFGMSDCFCGCTNQQCPASGGWSEWSSWSECSKSCGGGTRSRNRTCNNPPPNNGGAECEGENSETETCNSQPCIVDGGWTEWSSYSPCSKTCGGGERSKTRTCTNPAPKNGGADCPGNPISIEPCNIQSCTVHGKWSEWSGWSPCTKTCGGGTHERTRKCNNPIPENGGNDCEGSRILTDVCNTAGCVVNGEWSSWSSGECSRPCGGGTRILTRTCTNPAPENNGLDCAGESTKTQSCNNQPCLERDHLVDVIPTCGKQWNVSFKIQPIKKQSQWSNLVHLTATDKNCCDNGDRIPAIFFFPNSFRLDIRNSINNNGNNGYNSASDLPTDKFTDIRVEQTYDSPSDRYFWNVFIDENKVYSTVNKNPKSYKDVKVYSGDPWYSPADAMIKDLEYSCKDDLPDLRLKKNNLVDVIPTCGKQWNVSFKIQPIKRQSQWSNLVHLTATDKNCCGNGDRIPAIFFSPNSLKLHIRSSINNNGNAGYDGASDLPTDKFTDIRVEQTYDSPSDRYIWNVFIDGNKVYSTVNKNPKSYKDVKVYSGDPWYSPADAMMKDLEYSCKDDLPDLRLKKNNLVDVIPTCGKQWNVSFKIQPIKRQSQWSNLVHLTATDKNCCGNGDRIPAIFFFPNSLRLHIRSSINNNGNAGYDGASDLPTDKFTDIRVEQTYDSPSDRYFWNVFIDGNKVYSTVNKNPKSYKDVKVYSGDPWYSPADAMIKDLEYSCKDDLSDLRLKKNNLVNLIPKWERQWNVSFKVQPIKKQSQWSNLVHLTATDKNCCGNGDRIPAIFFFPNSLRLHIRSSINNNGNAGYDGASDLPADKFTAIRVEQTYDYASKRYIWNVFIDGNNVHSTVNKNPKSYKKVKVYSGDPWHSPGDALLKDLEYSSYLRPEPGKVVDDVSEWLKQWYVSFNVLPIAKHSKWVSLLHFTATGENCCNNGDRIPAIFFFPNSLRLHIRSSINNNGNGGYDGASDLPTDKFTSIRVEQTYDETIEKYKVKVFVGGNNVFSTVNKNPSVYSKGVKVYCGNKWHNPANALIKDLKYETYA